MIRMNRKMTDISGRVFGNWTVIKFEYYKSNYFWLCRCSCGEERIVSRNSLVNGRSKSCGHPEDIIGKKFGRLTVISYKDKKNQKSTIDCLCDCGKRVIVYASNVKSGKTKSCGCYQSENSSKICSETQIKNKKGGIYNWYFIDYDGKKVNCNSSYEVIFWNYFKKFRSEKLLYEPRIFYISEGRRYTPDFYIQESDLWIETKGSFESFSSGKKQKEKFDIFSKENNIKILFWKDLVDFCELPYKSQETYKNHSKKMNIPIEDYFAKMFYMEK